MGRFSTASPPCSSSCWWQLLRCAAALCWISTRGITPASSAPLPRSLQHVDQASASTAKCGISPLGYECFLQVCPYIALHWSLGGPPPAKDCMYPAADLSGAGGVRGAWNASAELLHFALESDLPGYVAMSLPLVLGSMSPADAIIGIQSGGVEAYHLVNHHSYPVDPSVPLQSRAVVSTEGGGLRVCASRPVAAVGAAGLALTLGQPLALNFATCSRPELHKHNMDPGHLCSARVSLLASAEAGGELAAAAAAGGGASPRNTRAAVLAHAVLMILAWIVLLPSGVMAARHRWMFHDPVPSKKATWFLWHQGLQLSGLVLFSVAFVLPWVAFGHHGGGHSEGWIQAHKVIGIVVACLAYLQLLLALLRPKPDAQHRMWWNFQHWSTGRLAALLGITNVLIGVQVIHEAWQDGRSAWYIAVLLLLGAAAAAATALEVKKQQLAPYINVSSQDKNLELHVNRGPSLSSPSGSRFHHPQDSRPLLLQ